MNIHEIIDKFVDSMDSNETNFYLNENAILLEELESKLPKRLPVSFQSLITRYSFNTFDYNDLSFFGNSPSGSDEDLIKAIFKDKVIAENTLKQSFIQFARPEGDSYDPICFDTNISRSRREFPIVRIDHEAILCRDKIHIINKISDSFLNFALKKIEGK